MPKFIIKTGSSIAFFAVLTFWLALVALVVCVGPMALAYDLNHLVPLATHQPLHVRWTQPAVFVAGFLLSEVAIPAAIIVWLLIAIGVLS